MCVIGNSWVFIVFAPKSGGVQPSIGKATTLSICSKSGQNEMYTMKLSYVKVEPSPTQPKNLKGRI